MDAATPPPPPESPEPDEHGWLQWPPPLATDPAVRRTVDREQYDEQILAALISP